MKIMQVTTLSPTFRSLPALSFFTFFPIFTISPVPSCPRATGISPKGSLLNSWASVPQTPHPSTFTSISPSPTSGMGNSFTSKCSRPVSIATCAVFGMEPPAVRFSPPDALPMPDILASTCFTISSICAVSAILLSSPTDPRNNISLTCLYTVYQSVCRPENPFRTPAGFFGPRETSFPQFPALFSGCTNCRT